MFNNADPFTSDRFADLSEAASEERSAACGVTITIRAAKVISPGQEILHCYGKKRRHLGKSNEGREDCEGADIFHKTKDVCISSDITVLLLSTYSVAQLPAFLRSPQQKDGDARTAASSAGTVLLPVSV